MNNSSAARGWQKVFGFTFVQFVKTKSFIVSSIIIGVIVILLVGGLNIIPKLAGAGDIITGSGDTSVEMNFRTVYLADEAGILNDEDTEALGNYGLHFTPSDKTADKLIEETSAADEGQAVILISADEDDGTISGYSVKVYYSPDTDSASIDAAAGFVSGMVTYRNMINCGVSPENFEASQRYVNTSKIEAGAGEWSVLETMINYIVPMVVSLILFILIFAYGQTVAQSIATEKTSRVMELLLTSVRPLAVVIGKVLAMGLISLLQFLMICILGVVSFAATAPFGIGGDIMKMMDNPALQTGQNADIAQALTSSFGTLSPLTFILIFVIFILGFLFFALIAALVGASVSRMEDLAQAMQPYSLLGVLGFYLAYFPVMTTMNSLESGAASISGMQMFSYFFPISSPFALPSALLLGTLSLPQVLIAVLILAAFDVLVAVVVARVYEMIILHNGSRLKFGDIIKMAGKK